jgi:hypothetical protein
MLKTLVINQSEVLDVNGGFFLVAHPRSNPYIFIGFVSENYHDIALMKSLRVGNTSVKNFGHHILPLSQ